MIWLVGTAGMLGQEVRKALEGVNIPLVATDREVDFTNFSVLEGFYNEKVTSQGQKLDWIVNCAAYTAVDKAEEDRELCFKLNVTGPENLGRLALKTGARVLHISTDYVFDGKGILDTTGNRRPYREEDPTGPQGYYGLTKAQGELGLLAADPRSLVVRTAWLYGAGGPNFVFTMLRLMKTKESLGVVADQWGTPTWAADLAIALTELMSKKDTPAGIYHFTGEGVTNWHEFALEIQKLGVKYGVLEKSCPVNPLTTDQYPTKTVRPAWSVLDKSKIKSLLQSPIQDWKGNLEHFFRTTDWNKVTL